MTADPQQPNPSTISGHAGERNYKYTRGALTARTPIGDNQVLEWSTQLNYQDLDHPLPFAIIDDTTYSWSSELRWTLAAPLFDHGNRVRVGLQFCGHAPKRRPVPEPQR